MLLGTAIGSLADYLPIMPPGRSWILQVDDLWASDNGSELMGYIKMEVDRTIVIDGKDCVRLVSTPVEFRDGEWQDVSSTAINVPYIAVIYAYQDLQTGSVYWLEQIDDSTIETDVDLPLELPQALYSFTLPTIDWWLQFEDKDILHTTVYIRGKERKAMYFDVWYFNEWVVDGIGAGSDLVWTDLPTGLRVVPVRTLLECRQDGEVIFTKEDFDALEVPGVNVEVSILEAESSEAPLYDLMGRRVTEPIPGSIYIRGGKKFIVPKR
ncbi:MAG: hypothetical protein K2F87_05350 [Muribaculaceae bacterium]|nr:hypothetical protein [Muribaculaceae bacterium]